MTVKSCSRPSKCSKRRTSFIIGRPGPCWIRRSTGLDAFAPRMRIHCRSAVPRIVGSIDLAVFRTLFSTFVRTLEHFTIWPSPGSQDGEPSGEEPPGVRGSLDGHLPWETALREPSRLVQTGSRPTSHRGGHWFDPSIAHPAQRAEDFTSAQAEDQDEGRVKRFTGMPGRFEEPPRVINGPGLAPAVLSRLAALCHRDSVNRVTGDRLIVNCAS